MQNLEVTLGYDLGKKKVLWKSLKIRKSYLHKGFSRFKLSLIFPTIVYQICISTENELFYQLIQRLPNFEGKPIIDLIWFIYFIILGKKKDINEVEEYQSKKNAQKNKDVIFWSAKKWK